MEVSKRLAKTIRYYIQEEYRDSENIKTKFDIFKGIKARIPIDDIKKVFVDDKYKWSIEKAEDFIYKEVVPSIDLITFLNYYFKNYYRKNQHGSKGAFAYIKSLEKSKRINFSVSNKINLRDRKEVLEFLEEMEGVRKKHLKITKSDFIEVIHNVFETGFTKSTLKRKFMDL